MVVLANAAKRVEPSLVHLNHRHGKLAIVHRRHVLRPPLPEQVKTLAVAQGAPTLVQPAAAVDELADAGDSVRLPLLYHVLDLAHIAGLHVYYVSFVAEGNMTLVILGRSAADKELTGLQMNDFGPILGKVKEFVLPDLEQRLLL